MPSYSPRTAEEVAARKKKQAEILINALLRLDTEDPYDTDSFDYLIQKLGLLLSNRLHLKSVNQRLDNDFDPVYSTGNNYASYLRPSLNTFTEKVEFLIVG